MHLFVCRLERDCTTRANVCTSSALSANLRINRVVFLSFVNSTQRAFIDTCTASDTIIGNLVSHNFTIYDLIIYDVRFVEIFTIPSAKVQQIFDTTKF